ncbi:MAG: gamma-glutamyltransferase, partial [Chitinophagales bacterium]
MRFIFICLIALAGCTSCSNQTVDKQDDQEFLSGRTHGILGDSAMVVCAHPEAAKVGADILKKGGNAIDAAISVQFALAVVYPNAGNIGGGGFMVIRMQTGEINALDFREKAPEHASRNMFLDPKTKEVDREKIESSHLASGVPGSVDGMWMAHQKYGSMPWKELIAPAIALAENGFAITEMQANDLNIIQSDLKKLNAGKNYFIKDAEWKTGDTLIQEDLANTLMAIAENGRDGFYAGVVADKIIAEMQLNDGMISGDDLKNYHAVWRTPIKGNYKNYEIISMPPPSSGGVALIQLLNMVENYPIDIWGFQSLNTMHIMVEAEKRVYADRATWLGDPDFVKIPVDELISKKYAEERMLNVDTIIITPSIEIKGGNIPGYESEETTHFSIADKYGNAVAVTTTLNDSYGSKITVAGCGFILNNE